jgi:hypothetical protein
MPILSRPKPSSHDRAVERAFDRRTAAAAKLLAAKPDLDEEALARLLAAREGVDEAETVCPCQLALFRAELISVHLRALKEFLPGARTVA